MLNGISTNSPVVTLGETKITLEIHNQKINCDFQVLNSPNNVPFDDLLGNDFLRQYKCKIDYSNSVMKMKTVPFEIPILRNTPQHNISTISINARTETIIPIKLINPHNISEGIVYSEKISNDDYLIIPKSLIKVQKNNLGLITVINKTNEDKSVSTYPRTYDSSYTKKIDIFSLAVNKTENNFKNRFKILNQNLRLDHLNTEEKQSLQNICKEFNDIFNLSSDILTKTTSTSQSIPVTNSSPIHVKSHRFPEIHKTKQIEKMLEQGIITPSTSPYSAPLWVIPKKLDASTERKWRLVIDYRKLNEITIGDQYPFPNI